VISAQPDFPLRVAKKFPIVNRQSSLAGGFALQNSIACRKSLTGNIASVQFLAVGITLPFRRIWWQMGSWSFPGQKNTL
jgi:hypothetical protein